jgi:hypothetical protein
LARSAARARTAARRLGLAVLRGIKSPTLSNLRVAPWRQA